MNLFVIAPKMPVISARGTRALLAIWPPAGAAPSHRDTGGQSFVTPRGDGAQTQEFCDAAGYENPHARVLRTSVASARRWRSRRWAAVLLEAHERQRNGNAH